MNEHGTLVLPSRRVLTLWVAPQVTPSSFFADCCWVIVRDFLGDLVVSIGTHVVRDRRVPPYLGSRSATTEDDPGEQARSVNLLETWGLVSRRGQRGNPLANGQNSSWVAKLTVDKTVGSSLTVSGACRKRQVHPTGMYGIANDWVTDRSTLILRGEWAQCTVWPQ